MSLIYEPKGRAREYAPLAANLYSGCTHACRYCYVSGYLARLQGLERSDDIERKRQEHHSAVVPKVEVLKQLRREVQSLRGDPRPVLMSFTCDPYSPAEEQYRLTHQALRILADNGLAAVVLTKGGMRAAPDFGLMASTGATFASTVVFVSEHLREQYEPGAASLESRRQALEEAHRQGIPTWLSLEPVIEPEEALAVVVELQHCVDQVKVGKVNDCPELEKRVDWPKFTADVCSLLAAIGKPYLIKDSLERWIPEGFRASTIGAADGLARPASTLF